MRCSTRAKHRRIFARRPPPPVSAPPARGHAGGTLANDADATQSEDTAILLSFAGLCWALHEPLLWPHAAIVSRAPARRGAFRTRPHLCRPGRPMASRPISLNHAAKSHCPAAPASCGMCRVLECRMQVRGQETQAKARAYGSVGQRAVGPIGGMEQEQKKRQHKAFACRPGIFNTRARGGFD